VKCPDCNTDNILNAKFCKKCGHPLVNLTTAASTGLICPGCGESNPSGAMFCRNCRMPLVGQAAMPAQQMPSGTPVNTVPASAPATDLASQIEVASPEQPHCATLLLLDTSGSMADSRKIQQLNEGLQIFKEEILKDELASSRVDVAVVTFGDGTVSVVHPFTSIQDFQPPQLRADGDTPMGEAILQGINLIESRKKIYRDLGVNYYRPWVFMITDGEPTDMKPGDQKWSQVKNLIEEYENKGKLLFFSVGVDPANLGLLNQIMPPNRGALKLKQGNFREMFQWLSSSQEKIVKSDVGPGEMVKLDAPSGWSEIQAK